MQNYLYDFTGDNYADKLEFHELNDPYYKPHQVFIQRFMSPNTLFHRLLLYFDMGTGKTATAIGVAQACLQHDIQRVIVLATSPNVVENFKQQAETHGATTFKYYTIYRFCKEIQNQDPNRFRHTLFIVDEAHHVHPSTGLITTEEEAMGRRLSHDSYQRIHTLFHSVPNCKILLLSGTPMTNKATDIIPLFNLILDADKQLVETDIPNQLADKIVNKVAYYTRPPHPLLKRTVRVKTLTQHGIQKQQYIGIDQDRSQLYQRSTQSGLFVDDGGRFGSQVQVPRNLTLESLRNHSNKYHYILQHATQHPNAVYLVYIDQVVGGGIKLFGAILERFGYKRGIGSSGRRNRYVLMTGATSRAEATKIIQHANASDTNTLRFICISKAFAEGITLSSVTDVMIVTPHWNRQFMDQIVYRVRPSLDVTRPFHVTIHELIGNDLDAYMYSISARKEAEMQPVRDILQSVAIDCFIHGVNCRTMPRRATPDTSSYLQMVKHPEVVDRLSAYFKNHERGMAIDILPNEHPLKSEYALFYHMYHHTPINEGYVCERGGYFYLSPLPMSGPEYSIYMAGGASKESLPWVSGDSIRANMDAETEAMVRALPAVPTDGITRTQEQILIAEIKQRFKQDRAAMEWVRSRSVVMDDEKSPTPQAPSTPPAPVGDYDFYGVLEKGGTVFKIKQRNNKGRGQNCTTTTKEKLVEYMERLVGDARHAEYMIMKKSELCELLRVEFERVGLLNK